MAISLPSLGKLFSSDSEQLDLSFGDYLEHWLNHAKARVRVRTHEGYTTAIGCYIPTTLRELPLRSLHPLHLQNLYAALLGERGEKRTLSAGTVLNLHLILNNALSQAVRWQLIPANPAAGAQPPRPRRVQHKVFDPAALEELLHALRGHWLELPAAIAISTGMRRGELLALRWSDLNTERTHAHVNQSIQPTRQGLIFEQPKTARSRRTIALPTYLQPYLAKQANDQVARCDAHGDRWRNYDLVIDRGDGQPLNPNTLTAGWGRFLRSTKLPYLRFHDLRHSHATLMLLAGVHPKIVSERLGHASIGLTLDTYTHVLPSMQQQAADAFDELFPSASAA